MSVLFQIVLNIKYLNDSYLKKLIYHNYLHLNGFKFNLPENIRETLLYYLNVNNRTEFIERQFKLNDKTANDFNGVQKQFDFFRHIIKCRFGDSKRFSYSQDYKSDCGYKFRKDLTILMSFIQVIIKIIIKFLTISNVKDNFQLLIYKIVWVFFRETKYKLT